MTKEGLLTTEEISKILNVKDYTFLLQTKKNKIQPHHTIKSRSGYTYHLWELSVVEEYRNKVKDKRRKENKNNKAQAESIYKDDVVSLEEAANFLNVHPKQFMEVLHESEIMIKRSVVLRAYQHITTGKFSKFH